MNGWHYNRRHYGVCLNRKITSLTDVAPETFLYYYYFYTIYRGFIGLIRWYKHIHTSLLKIDFYRNYRKIVLGNILCTVIMSYGRFKYTHIYNLYIFKYDYVKTSCVDEHGVYSFFQSVFLNGMRQWNSFPNEHVFFLLNVYNSLLPPIAKSRVIQQKKFNWFSFCQKTSRKNTFQSTTYTTWFYDLAFVLHIVNDLSLLQKTRGCDDTARQHFVGEVLMNPKKKYSREQVLSSVKCHSKTPSQVVGSREGTQECFQRQPQTVFMLSEALWFGVHPLSALSFFFCAIWAIRNMVTACWAATHALSATLPRVVRLPVIQLILYTPFKLLVSKLKMCIANRKAQRTSVTGLVNSQHRKVLKCCHKLFLLSLCHCT